MKVATKGNPEEVVIQTPMSSTEVEELIKASSAAGQAAALYESKPPFAIEDDVRLSENKAHSTLRKAWTDFIADKCPGRLFHPHDAFQRSASRPIRSFTWKQMVTHLLFQLRWEILTFREDFQLPFCARFGPDGVIDISSAEIDPAEADHADTVLWNRVVGRVLERVPVRLASAEPPPKVVELLKSQETWDAVRARPILMPRHNNLQGWGQIGTVGRPTLQFWSPHRHAPRGDSPEYFAGNSIHTSKLR